MSAGDFLIIFGSGMAIGAVLLYATGLVNCRRPVIRRYVNAEDIEPRDETNWSDRGKIKATFVASPNLGEQREARVFVQLPSEYNGKNLSEATAHAYAYGILAALNALKDKTVHVDERH